MAEVIQLNTKGKATKSITYNSLGQKYTVTFDPNAPFEQRWVWHCDYVQTFRYVGSASSLEGAAKSAQRKIQSLNKWVAAREEAGE